MYYYTSLWGGYLKKKKCIFKIWLNLKQINRAVIQKITIFLSNLYVVLHDMDFLLFVHLYFVILIC